MKKAILGMMGAAAVCAGAALADSSTVPAPTIPRNESLDTNLEQQIKPTLNAFEAAWNKHDPQGLASNFQQDAVLINPYGRIARGRAEILKLFQDEQQRGPMKDSQFSYRVTDIRQPAPGVALVDQEITLSGIREPNGTQADTHIHNPMLLTNKTGKWLVLDARPYRFARPPSQPAVGGSGAGSTQDSTKHY